MLDTRIAQALKATIFAFYQIAAGLRILAKKSTIDQALKATMFAVDV